MFGWLQARHRRQILERPFPESWNSILERNVAHWKFLDDAERGHLRSLVQVFVAEKEWDGCGGLELTEEIQVTIAGLACLVAVRALTPAQAKQLLSSSRASKPHRQSADRQETATN